jgi:hypothetical protein
MNDLIHNLDKTNFEENTLKLDIYYYIDLDEDIVHNFLDNNLEDIFLEYIKDFDIDKLIKVQSNNITKEDDIIKRGTNMFDNMFDKLKLKNSNALWFIYISKGSLKTNTSIIQDVYIGLINKDPSIKRCFYSIHKENDKNNMIKSVNIILKKMFLNKQKMICY